MRILSAIILISGLFIIFINYTILFRYYFLKKRDKSYSCIPIIGGLLTLIGMISLGNGLIKSLAFIPLFVDIGCLPMIVFALYSAFIAKNKVGS
jgi:hypothetical protein